MKSTWYRYAIALMACIGLAVTTTQAQVILNEIHQNPEGGGDATNEFIELYGRPGMDLTGYAIGLLSGGIDSNNNGVIDPGEQLPEIDEAYSLDGLTLGANGFLVIFNDASGFTDLTIDPMSNSVGFSAVHIPTTDTAGNLENDGSPTFVLVRRRPNHSIDMSGMSVYGTGYAFRKDVRHDVNSDGEVDFGTETNTIGSGEPAMMVEHYQMVDDVAWSNGGGLEYVRDRDNEINDTPAFNPDAVSRLRYYCTNPRRGYRTIGNLGSPFGIETTNIADESFIYGEMLSSVPVVFDPELLMEVPNPDYNKYNTSLDADGLIQTKAPTELSALFFTGNCDPEPDDAGNPACVGDANGVYPISDLDVTDFVLTPGSFNDLVSSGIMQFRFIPGDFNADGLVNHIDERLILDRIGRGLDDTTPAVYAAGTPEEVMYNEYDQQGAEFQKVLMMAEMDMAESETVTTDDYIAFQALCSVCGVASNADIRITEYMYTGNGDEFIEFTNVGATPVDMTGYSYSDSGDISGEFDLSAFGIVAPGESVILTQDDTAQFKLAWGIPGVKVIGYLGEPIGGNLGRGDQINLYDNGGILVDRLTYDDRIIPGSPRTNGVSAWPCDIAIGNDDAANWRSSQAGADPQNSFASVLGDTGNPGTFVLDDCTAAPLPTGACCQQGGCIEGDEVTQVYCDSISGIYQGDGTVCATAMCPQPSGAVVLITEYLYSGTDGEFFEITNLDTNPVDISNWRADDDSNSFAAGLDFGAIGTLAVGESAIVTEAMDITVFRTAWGIAPTVKVIGGLGTTGGGNLGRNDQINLYDTSGTLVDRLTYGDENFPGTFRAQDTSARPCLLAIGNDDIANWTASSVGDLNNSVTSSGGDVGSPGEYVEDACVGDDPTGACCFNDGTCQDELTQTICEGTGGLYQGDDSLCVNVTCPQPGNQMIRITEWEYSGNGDNAEFVEFTNVGAMPVNIGGWRYDDSSFDFNEAEVFIFPGEVIAPGQSFIMCECPGGVEDFRSEWMLDASTLIVGPYTNNLGGSDQINLWDPSANLIDQLNYSDSNFPGSIRANGASGWPCIDGLGQNDVYLWTLSTVGDVQGSYASTAGDIGNPGTFVEDPCPEILTGACCLAGVCTDDLAETDCDLSGGIYQGDGTTCGTTSCPQPSNAQVRITEYMYSGDDGEFIEIVNFDANPVDLTGWRVNDMAASYSTGYDLSALGTIQPGEVVVITEETEVLFRAAWSIAPTVKIAELYADTTGGGLGRTDAIVVLDASAAVVDRLDYGDEVFIGSFRTQRTSAWACTEVIGTNDVIPWIASAVGDVQGSTMSTQGDIANPGVFTSISCNACFTCSGDVNGDNLLNGNDVQAFIDEVTGPAANECADTNNDNNVSLADVSSFVTAILGGGC